MAFWINENILRFQISVDDTHLMQVRKGTNHFSCIETGPVFIKSILYLFKVVEKFSPIDKLHYQIQSLTVLKGKF